jgi:hypothetical protein
MLGYALWDFWSCLMKRTEQREAAVVVVDATATNRHTQHTHTHTRDFHSRASRDCNAFPKRSGEDHD